MNVDEVIKRKDDKQWEVEAENEHDKMTKKSVWKVVKSNTMPKGARFLNSSWAIKMK